MKGTVADARKDRVCGDSTGADDKEKRIRFDTIKRRRAHALRAKLSEESEEKRYSEALSQRQNVKQEYVKLVRKQFRHWRKQGSPSPYRDKSALPEAHWDRDSTRTPTAPWQAGSTDSVKAEANVRVFTGAVYRTAREGEGQEGGGIVRPRSGTQEVSGIVELPGKEERGEAAMEPARGVQAKQQSGRWANLPPELRAIKDRWLGASVEDLGPAASAALRGDEEQRRHQDVQEERHGDPIQGVQQGTSASTAIASPAMPMPIARPPQKSSIAMPVKFLEGDSESETPCEDERSQGGDEDISSRGMSTDCLERGNVQRKAPETRQRRRDTLPHPAGTIKHECPVNSSREGGDAFGERVRAVLAKQSTLADTFVDDSAPEEKCLGTGVGVTAMRQVEECLDAVIDEGEGSIRSIRPAPAYGGEVGDRRENETYRNARNQLQALRGRLSRSKPGENGPTLSPPYRLKPGNELPPDVGKHGRGVSLTRPGAGVGTRVETQKGTAKEIRGEENVTPKGEDSDGKGDLCGDLGTGPLHEDHGTARKTIGAVDLGDGDDGQKTLQPESSVRSRPSELFDSLELSASASQNGGAPGRGGLGQSYADVKTAPREGLTSTSGIITPMDVPAQEVETQANVDIGNNLEPTAGRCAVSKALTAPAGATPVVDIARSQTLAGGTSVTADITTPSNVRRLDRESDEAQMVLLPPVHLLASPPAATLKDVRTTGKQSGHKPRGPSGSSRLRSPGWGRRVAITPIPPAAAGIVSSAAGASAVPRAIEAGAALVPGHLLTPVTEVATADERSAISYSTPGTSRMTPTPSAASGSRSKHGSSAARHRSPYRSPNRNVGDCRRRPLVATRAERHESTATDSVGNGCERTVWGIAGSSGANSAPGGVMSGSSLAYRSLLSSGGVGARASTFSSDSGGREVGGGYVAAMGRRARSAARCEAARRLVSIARVTGKARPSTPIEERARWGKGRNTRAEVERRKLLRRRSEYADELMRKAKCTKQEDASALAARNKTTTPSKTRGGGEGVTPPTAHRYDSPASESASPADKAHGSRARAIPRAVGNTILATEGIGAMGKIASSAHHLPCEASRKVPAHGCLEPTRGEVECLAGGVGVGCGGVFPGDPGSASGRRSTCRGSDGSGRGSFARGREAGGRSVPVTESTAQAAVGDEEKRLMASIARLDTLLQKERSGIPTSSTGTDGGGSGVETRERQERSGGGIERGRNRPRKGGITKSRVRKGGGEDTKASGSACPNGTTPLETSTLASTTLVSSSVVATTGGVSIAPTPPPVLFPSLYRGVPLSENRLDGGRYRQHDKEANLERDMAVGVARGFSGEGKESQDHGRGAPRGRLPASALPERSRQPIYTDHQQAAQWESRAPIHEQYQSPYACHQPTFTPPRRTVHNYRDDNGGARGPRYPVRQEEGWMEPGPRTPVSYQEVPPDVGRQDLRRAFGGDRYDIRNRDERRGHCEDDRLTDVPHDVWHREMERQEWEGGPLHRGGYVEARSDARGKGGRTDWDRCNTFARWKSGQNVHGEGSAHPVY